MVSSQTGDSSCPRQSTLEQTSEIGAKCMQSVPSEVQHLLGSEAVENEPRDAHYQAVNGVINEKQQLISGEALKNSSLECLGQPAKNVSKNVQTNEIPCSQQTTSEKKYEFGDVYMHSKQLEQADHVVLNEHGETSTMLCTSLDDDKLGLLSEDACNNCQTDIEQLRDFGSGNKCNKFDAECIHSKPSEQKDVLGSGNIQNEPVEVDDIRPTASVGGNLQPYSEDLTNICPSKTLEFVPEDGSKNMETGDNSCPRHHISELKPESTVRIRNSETLEVNQMVGSELLQNKPVETSTAVFCRIAMEQLGSSLDLVNKSSSIEHLNPLPEVSTKIPSAEHSVPSSDDMVRNSGLQESGRQAKYPGKNFKRVGRKTKKPSKLLNKQYTLRSRIGSDIALRSRSEEKCKAPKSNNNLADASSHDEKKRKKKNDKRSVKTIVDDYSRIKKQLRYLLNRINYEKSLIAAYSGEGWKGLNLEKLKPEKELQRATSEILRRKLRIRELFRHLDSLCAEGMLPTSLFDSDGQIDSEDIFCAKCGSKDLSLGNDIILCDGACDRGFHQYCLQPPLLKEDIPPDDEGWLCPGCDCKVDCIDTVNESEGTSLSITDNWEKVFPEAAAGQNQGSNFGLPSDDSDDNDYNPDGSATDEKDQGDESSSDESEYATASDELKASANDDVYLGLPSDDSEDDDYNPDAPEPDEKVMEESSSSEGSSSDFTSESEDLEAVLEVDRSPGEDGGTTSASPLRDSNGQRFKGNTESLNNEPNMSESGQHGGTSVYEKRCIEKLDYKKLYDETYGNLSSSSSDDEDWNDNGPSLKERTEECSPVLANGNACAVQNQKTRKNINQSLKVTKGACKRKAQKLNSNSTGTLPSKSHEGCSRPGSSDKKSGSSYRRLGEHVTQTLYDFFKQNKYPDRTAKQNLGEELGLTFQQVSKWFENARWSFNHSSSMSFDDKMAKSDPGKGRSSPKSSKQSPQLGPETVTRVSTSNGTENVESSKARAVVKESSSMNLTDSELARQESNRKESATSTSRKRKRKDESGNQASQTKSESKVTQDLAAVADSSKAQETQTGGRILRSRRKSAV